MRVAKAHACECVDNESDAARPRQLGVPAFRRWPVEHAHPTPPLAVPEQVFNFTRQGHGFGDRPARVYASVGKDITRFGMHQWKTTQPIQQDIGVGSVDQIIHRVVPAGLDAARRDGQRPKIVVAQHGRGASAQAHDAPERSGRLRASVDQVAHEPDPACRVICDLWTRQQCVQRCAASVDVAHRPDFRLHLYVERLRCLWHGCPRHTALPFSDRAGVAWLISNLSFLGASTYSIAF